MCARQQPAKTGDAEYWCPTCGMSFDNDPNEGGDYAADPSRRIERSEERRASR